MNRRTHPTLTRRGSRSCSERCLRADGNGCAHPSRPNTPLAVQPERAGLVSVLGFIGVAGGRFASIQTFELNQIRLRDLEIEQCDVLLHLIGV